MAGRLKEFDEKTGAITFTISNAVLKNIRKINSNRKDIGKNKINWSGVVSGLLDNYTKTLEDFLK